MDYKALYKKILNKVSFKKNDKKPYARDFNHDWEMLVISAVIFLIAIFVAGAFFYYKIFTNDIFTSTIDAGPEPVLINQANLDSTANFYNNKEQAFTNLEATSTRSVDPSSSD